MRSFEEARARWNAGHPLDDIANALGLTVRQLSGRVRRLRAQGEHWIMRRKPPGDSRKVQFRCHGCGASCWRRPTANTTRCPDCRELHGGAARGEHHLEAGAVSNYIDTALRLEVAMPWERDALRHELRRLQAAP